MVAHLRLKAHIDHLVRLVEDDIVALVKHHVPSVERVVEPSWRGHHHLDSLRLDEGLLLYAKPTNHRVHADLKLRGELRGR